MLKDGAGMKGSVTLIYRNPSDRFDHQRGVPWRHLEVPVIAIESRQHGCQNDGLAPIQKIVQRGLGASTQETVGPLEMRCRLPQFKNAPPQ